jgi:3-oxoadipate enol-lactonase
MNASPVHLNFELTGRESGPTVVFLSSIGLDLSLWDRQVDAVGEVARVLRYDHRGHGGSDIPPGPYEIADLGRDLFALLDLLGIERAVLCGLSLGGMVAMWCAASEPERVSHLIVACSSAAPGDSQKWNDRADLVRRQGMRAISERVPTRWFTAPFARRNSGVVAAYRKVLERTDPEGYAATCEAISGFDLLSDLPRIDARTVVVCGGDDEAFPREHSEAITNAVPGAELIVLSPAAHLANVEASADFNRVILSHLEAGTPQSERRVRHV